MSVPWLFMVTHEQLEPGVDVAATLDACGLAVVMPMTGMLARTVAAAAAVPVLQLTVPQNDGGCAAILDVNALAYGMDLEAGKATIVPEPSGRISFRLSRRPARSRPLNALSRCSRKTLRGFRPAVEPHERCSGSCRRCTSHQCSPKRVSRRPGLSFPTAAKGMTGLAYLGLARELTGNLRNRVFACDRNLAILGEATDPLCEVPPSTEVDTELVKSMRP